MHYLCSTFGSAGDVFPMLGLALELHRRGHQVTVAVNEHFAGMVHACGLEFSALGTAAEFHACIRDPDLWHPQRSFGHVFRTMQSVLRRQFELHVDAARRGPVTGLTSCFGFGALMAQDAHKIPVLTVHLQPAVIWSDVAPPALAGLFGPRWLKSLMYRLGERLVIDPVVCPFLNPWRQELGLQPVRRVTRYWHSPRGILCLFPDWFAAPQSDWPAPCLQADFPLWNFGTDHGLAHDVGEFLNAGDPPLVFTPGSANVHGREFFAAAVEACRTLRQRGILLTSFVEQVPSPLPEGIAVFPFVPLDQLLPRCAAFVHHGGVGSASQAMLAGIPQVLMPMAHDQFDNAVRIRSLGIGDSIPERKFTTARLVPALERLLNSREVSGHCEAIAGRLKSRSGLTQAADWLTSQ